MTKLSGHNNQLKKSLMGVARISMKLPIWKYFSTFLLRNPSHFQGFNQSHKRPGPFLKKISVHYFRSSWLDSPMIWWHNDFNFSFAVTQNRFKGQATISGQGTRLMTEKRTKHIFHRKGISTQHAHNNSERNWNNF